MPKTSIVPCHTYDAAAVRAALIEALTPLGGLDFICPGMRIGIKMNLVTRKNYHAAVTTHPVVLAELARLIQERGGQAIIGDSPGGPFSAAFLRSLYGPAGLSIAEKAGAQLNYDTRIEKADFPSGKILKTITYTGWLADCDAVITCAKFKTHAMLGMTGAVKNQFGIVRGLMEPEFHALYPKVSDFCNMLIDLNEFIKPQLAIIDGIDGMEGNGPSAGTVRHIGCLIASDSVYHADVVMAELMGLRPADMPLIHAAHLRGLAPETTDELSLFGSADAFRMEDFKSLPCGGVQFGGREDSALMQIIRSLLTRRPSVDAHACIGCGLCARNCPAGAIQMKGIPKFHLRKCIRCFCCQELCPKEAISVKAARLNHIGR